MSFPPAPAAVRRPFGCRLVKLRSTSLWRRHKRSRLSLSLFACVKGSGLRQSLIPFRRLFKLPPVKRYRLSRLQLGFGVVERYTRRGGPDQAAGQLPQ